MIPAESFDPGASSVGYHARWTKFLERASDWMIRLDIRLYFSLTKQSRCLRDTGPVGCAAPKSLIALYSRGRGFVEFRHFSVFARLRWMPTSIPQEDREAYSHQWFRRRSCRMGASQKYLFLDFGLHFYGKMQCGFGTMGFTSDHNSTSARMCCHSLAMNCCAQAFACQTISRLVRSS